jgi:hypothetical protein
MNYMKYAIKSNIISSRAYFLHEDGGSSAQASRGGGPGDTVEVGGEDR